MAPACLKVWLGKQTHAENNRQGSECWEVGGAGARGADGWGPRPWGSGQESLGWMFQLSLKDEAQLTRSELPEYGARLPGVLKLILDQEF